MEIGRLVDRRLTRVHAADPENYRPGDVVVANRDVYGLREGEAWTVVGTGEDGVRLERRGECRAFAPSGNAARNLSLCESRPLPLRAGDEIVWTRNLRRRGLINGERATVERIAGVRIDVRTHSGRALRFAVDDDDLRHIDHAWSSTVYRAQGLTRDNVIAVLDSASMMSDRAMLYVEMSRARDGFVLLTDDTEQLVSRLEREGERVSSALEAAGQAPWLEPDMAVTEKPALWPVLAEWRAHVQRAEEISVLPFHLEGCDALMARMGALAEKDALPVELAEVLEEHRPFAEDRAMVSKWASSMLEIAGRRERMLAEAAASGTAATSLPGHAAWSRRAERALDEGMELKDEDRYGVHLDRIAGARAQLGEPLGALDCALEFDGNAASLQSEWRAWERGEGDGTLEDFAACIAALAREAAPGEMPPDLSRAAEEIAERQREAEERRRKEEERRLAERKARDAQLALEALARERTQLLHAAAAVEPVAKRPDWQDWRDRAEAAMAEAVTMAEDAALGNATREALAASAEALARGLAVEREAAELHRRWQEYFVPTAAGDIHRFHAPGSAALADRTATLEERVTQPLEMPGLLRMGLDDHRKRAEEWSRIGNCRDELARLAKRPEPDSEAWLRDARRAARAATAILNDGIMCRAHGLDGTPMGEEIEGNAVALVREFRVHDASETLLRDWAEHAGAAAGEGLHPFHAPGYDALLDRIRDHEGKAGERLPAPLARVLEEHEALVRADREARKLTARLDACLEKRDARCWSGRSKSSFSSSRWSSSAGGMGAGTARRGAPRRADASSSGNDRYADHLSALGGRATIERAVERIERAAVLDHLPAEVVAACETLDDRVRETGRHRFFLPGHKRACDLMSSLRYDVRHGSAEAFVKNELSMREKMSERAQLLDKTKTLLEECQQERDRTATDDLPFVQQKNYGAWRYKAQSAVDNAKSMLADEAGNGPVLQGEPGSSADARRPIGIARAGRCGKRTRTGNASSASAPSRNAWSGAAAGARGSRCDTPSAAGVPGKRPPRHPGWLPRSVDQTFAARPGHEPLGDADRFLLAVLLGQQRNHLPGTPVADHVQHRRPRQPGNRAAQPRQYRPVLFGRAGRHPRVDAFDPVVYLLLLALAQRQPRRRADLAVPVARQLHRQRALDQVARHRQPRRVRPFPHTAPIPYPCRRGNGPWSPGFGAASFPRLPPERRGTFQKGERLEHGEVASRQALVHRPDAAVEERDPVVERSLLLFRQRQHGYRVSLRRLPRVRRRSRRGSSSCLPSGPAR